jgi:hypothetical protein
MSTGTLPVLFMSIQASPSHAETTPDLSGVADDEFCIQPVAPIANMAIPTKRAREPFICGYHLLISWPPKDWKEQRM